MNTATGFLHAILNEPDSDDHRLIYADWLEENGRAERAELIRVQCEIARHHAIPPDEPPLCGCKPRTPHENGCRWERLLIRDIQLMGAHYHEWLAQDFPVARYGPIYYDGSTLTITALREPWIDAYYRRGFVEKVRCEAARFFDRAGQLFRLAPIQEVTLKENTHHSPFWAGYPINALGNIERVSGGMIVTPSVTIPGEVWEMVEGEARAETGKWFPSEQAALDAASAAFVKFGRAMAAKASGPRALL